MIQQEIRFIYSSVHKWLTSDENITPDIKQQPRPHMALVTRSKPKIGLDTRVTDFAVLYAL